MAMDPVGHIAGTASSIPNFVASVGAMVVGSLIGQSYSGKAYLLAIRYLGIGLAVLVVVYVIEDGQLFDARNTA
jgi:MFS transporter, DHA1 family, multidrug resistance protein